jgi:hypothetical protein
MPGGTEGKAKLSNRRANRSLVLWIIIKSFHLTPKRLPGAAPNLDATLGRRYQWTLKSNCELSFVLLLDRPLSLNIRLPRTSENTKRDPPRRSLRPFQFR